MDLELKEEDLLDHCILKVLVENNKMDMFETPSFAKLRTMVYSNFIQRGMQEYSLDLESDNIHSSSGPSNYWLGRLEQTP